MKKALITAFILIAILLAIPFAEGIWVEKKYYAMHKLVSQRTPLAFEVIDYHRGWFSSSATIKVIAGSAATAQTTPGNSHFIVKEKLYHGPIILRSSKPLELEARGLTFAVALGEIQVKQPDLQLSSLATYHYNGNIDVQFDCPNFSFPTIKPGESYGIQGLKGSFRFTKHFKHSQGQILLTSANLPFNDSHQTISNASYSYALNNTGLDLWTGKRNLQIAQFAFNATDKWQAQGLSLLMSDQTNGHDLDSHFEAKINELKLNDTNFGKQQLSFNLGHLNLEALSELGQKADFLDQQSSSMGVRALELTPLALQLLNKGLSLNLSEVELNTKWGLLSGNAFVEMPKQDKQTTQIANILSNIIGKADINIPAKLLQEVLEIKYQALTTPEQQKLNSTTPQSLAKDNIDRWILAGWLIPSDDHYRMNLSYKTNQLLLNGKPMKLPNLPIPSIEPHSINR